MTPYKPHFTSQTFEMRRCGFTLLEIILVLSLLAIISAAAIPAIQGLREDEEARRTLTQVSHLAKETRLRAMQEQRPYQIAFTPQSITATRYLNPYIQAEELSEFLQQLEVLHQNPPADSTPPPLSNSDASNTVQLKGQWHAQVQLPEGTQYSIQKWHAPTPVEISGNQVILWVFQPTGIVEPITFRFQQGRQLHSVSFDALTADVRATKSETL